MKIDRNLNLVLKIESGGTTIHLHSQPVSRTVFEANYRLIARTHSELFGRGTAYAIGSGPKIASLALRDAGEQNALERGDAGDGGASSFLIEIKRLTMVVCPTDAGWSTIPVDVAIGRGLLDPEDWEEAENAIAFFILVSAMTARSRRQMMQETTARVMGAQTVLQSSTEFAEYLRTLTQPETSFTPAPAAAPSRVVTTAGSSVPS